MKEISLRQGEGFIKLGQLLKKADLVSSGVEAKIVILEGQVRLNGVTEERRGKKVYPGDIVSFQGEDVKVIE